MKAILSQLGDLWCHAMHSTPRWPVRGYYECPDCLRRHPVPWANRAWPHQKAHIEPSPASLIQEA
jgi:hypothetical protein